MFSLGVSPREIQDTLFQLKDVIYPQSIKLAELTHIIFGTSTDIQQRKVRLAIKLLRKQGHLIIAKNGYSFAGDDPEVVIHFINGMYSRAHSLTQDADIMYHVLKQKYGDEVSAKVEQLPGQPMLPEKQLIVKCINDIKSREPSYKRDFTINGMQIDSDFELDA